MLTTDVGVSDFSFPIAYSVTSSRTVTFAVTLSFNGSLAVLLTLMLMLTVTVNVNVYRCAHCCGVNLTARLAFLGVTVMFTVTITVTVTVAFPVTLTV